MKIYLIAIIGVSFIALFRENPVGAVVILCVVGLGYFFYKSRTHTGKGGVSTLLGGRGHDTSNDSMKLLTFIALSKMFEDRPEKNQGNRERIKDKDNADLHEKAKREILKIFDR